MKKHIESNHLNTTLVSQVFLGFWLVYSLLVVTYYKTALTSTLAVPFKPPLINTLQELLTSNIKPTMVDLKVGVILRMISNYDYSKNGISPCKL